MKKIVVLALLWLAPAFGSDACSPGLFSFVCKDTQDKIQTNRCGSNRGCYDLKESGQTLRCCPSGQSTDHAKLSFMELIQNPNSKNLTKFKDQCTFSSPVDFNGDMEVIDVMKMLFKNGNTYSIRALIYAESHCADITNHEAILSWLGNEFLIGHTQNLIQAFFDEGKNEHLSEIALLENTKWRGLECKDDLCRLNRNTYFGSKLDALQHVKVAKNLEPIRKELLKDLQSVSDAATRSFINLGHESNDHQLTDFKKKCTVASPVDFKRDPEVHGTVQKALDHGNVGIIRAMIYAEAHCADITSRKIILTWLGNEILINHPANLIQAAEAEDQKHELYDIAEVSNQEWKDKQCLDDPCKMERKAYFSTKRKALSEAKIEKRLEPYRRMLLKGLTSDQ